MALFGGTFGAETFTLKQKKLAQNRGGAPSLNRSMRPDNSFDFANYMCARMHERDSHTDVSINNNHVALQYMGQAHQTGTSGHLICHLLRKALKIL